MSESATNKGGTNKSVEFSIDGSYGGASKRRSTSKSGRRRGSFFRRMSASFRRSSGNRGADVDTLRGTHGPDFEGFAIVHRGGITTGCGCFGRGGPKERLLLIKGPFCFVFSDEYDTAPKYAISLAHLKARKLPSAGNTRTTVNLETSLGDIEYEMEFTEVTIADHFAEAVTRQAAVGETEEVRKNLGHEHLLHKRTSIRYAEKVALKKIESQPEKDEKVPIEEMTSFNAMAAL